MPIIKEIVHTFVKLINWKHPFILGGVDIIV